MFAESDNIKQSELNDFRINKKYEKKFLVKQKKVEEDRAKKIYGRDWEKHIDAEDEDSGSDLAEDENGELFNDSVAMKFITTLAKLKKKDPEIYKPEVKFFQEEDFDHAEVLLGKRGDIRSSQLTKKLTYKDQVRQQALAGDMAGSESESENGSSTDRTTKRKHESDSNMTPYQLEQAQKRDFKKAAKWDAEDESDNSDGGFLKKKEKPQDEIEEEDDQLKAILALKKKENKHEAKIIKKAFGKPEKMDEEDAWLRNFILKKGWKDENDLQYIDDIVDMEDEMKDEEFDKFEERINFRYEPGGSDHQKNVKLYERDVPGSMRDREKKQERAEHRKEVKDRKKQEKDELKQSVQVLKDIKRQKIEERLKQLVKISGLSAEGQKSSKNDKLAKMIEGDFDETEFDQNMEQLFDEDYFEDEEENAEELKAYIKDIEKEFDDQILGDTTIEKKDEGQDAKPKYKSQVLQEDKENLLIPKTNVPISLKKKLDKTEAELMAQSLQEPIWWFCDTCYKGIKPLEHRFECLDFDFTQCKNCANLKTHQYPMKKFVVPEGCVPPSDEEILKILEKFVICNECDCKMDGTFRYYKSKVEEDYFLCEDCYSFQITNKSTSKSFRIKDFEVSEPTQIDISRAIENKEFDKLKGGDMELDELIDDYANLDFEDVIAGGIKTRFSYTEVPKESFMLTDEELLYCDDKVLNKFLALKKIVPYKDQEVMVTSKHWKNMKKMKTLVRSSAQKNKEKFLKEIEILQEEQELKNLAKKNPKHKKKLEKFLETKEERIRCIYADDSDSRANNSVKLTNLTKQNVDEIIKSDGALISQSRLKAYGLQFKNRNMAPERHS